MAKILAYTSPARGHLFPLIPILDELRLRGHEIILTSLASEAEAMRARGFDAHRMDPQIEAIEHDDWRGRSQRESLARVMRAFRARAAFEVPDLRRAVADERPDAILVDINCWGAQAVAAASGRPWATFCPYPIPLPSPDAPPYGPGFAPARGGLGRLRDRLLGPVVRGTYERAALPAMNASRIGLGLSPLRDVNEWLNSQPLVLYLTAEPFEYPHREWPDNIVMVGPCDWSPDAEPPQWLDQLEHPIVLVTTSSEFQNDGRLVRTALEALSGEPFTVVATLPASDIGDARVPANARVERFVPHAPLLDRAVCAITHAGMGATQKALARGVPVCAVPFARDQFEVARRVEVAGAGTRLSAKRLRPDRLRGAVHEAIRRRAGAARIAEAFAAAGGPGAAADALEKRVLPGR
jgi:UDP:flavonoid glycosyltransferase YjiC (YdhE family)